MKTSGSFRPGGPVAPLAHARLFDQVIELIRSRQYSILTENVYVHWTQALVCFYGGRQPGGREGQGDAFLAWPVDKPNEAMSTLRPALSGHRSE